MADASLLRPTNLQSKASQQRTLLESNGCRKSFERSLAEHGLFPLRACGIEVLQVNLGRLCNQACRHCHVGAGPDRREVINGRTIRTCLEALARSDVPVLDVTGGAPEMNPHFRHLVVEARRLGRRVIDRCNLTILLADGFQDLPEFLAAHQVEVVASLPCYLAENVDAQRGRGVLEQSIEGLRRLNALGYGRPQSGLTLNLVYNPAGPALPPPQDALEAAYRRELKTRYNVVFDRLFAITNMPIGRFLDGLIRDGRYASYMDTLVDAFTPQAAAGVMCRSTLSVDWTGRLHDCDFNQMLELGLEGDVPQCVEDLDPAPLATRRIVIGQHCYGCTAGPGSSCRGTTVRVEE